MDDRKVIDITKEVKRAERKAKIEALGQKAKDIWENYKGAIIVGTPIVLGVGKRIINHACRAHRLNLEERNRYKHVYDPSLGMYYELRRKLTNKDKLIIDRRKKNGETIGSILEDLGILK